MKRKSVRKDKLSKQARKASRNFHDYRKNARSVSHFGKSLIGGVA